MDYSLQDLVEIPVLQDMLDRLHAAIPFAFVLCGRDNARIAESGQQDACLRFHRACPASRALCVEYSARTGSVFHGSSEIMTVECPMGGVDSSVPVVAAGQRVGTLIVSQVFLKKPDMGSYREIARRFGYDEQDYLAAVARIPVVTREELDRSLQMLRIFTGMLGELGAKRMGELEALARLREANEKLARAAGYNRGLIEANASAMAVIGPDGVVTDVNAAAEALTGRSRKDLVGAGTGSSIVDPALARAAIARALREDRLTDLRTEITRSDGRRIPVQFSLNSVDAGGQRKGMLVTARDLSQDLSGRLQAERALQASEERFRALFEAMTDGVVVHDVVYEGGKAVDYVIRDVNPAYERHMGITRERALGARASQLYGAGEPPFLDVCARVAETGASETMDVFIASPGKHFNVSVFSPGKGQIACVFSDVTGNRKAEADLRAAKEYAEGLIDTANAMVVVLDSGGYIREFNREAEELTGWKRQEVLGRDWFELFVPKHRCPKVWAKFRQLRQKGFPGHNENPVLTKLGGEIQIAWHNSLLRHNGEVTGLVSFGMDVTERHRMENDLRAYKERLDLVLKNLDAMIFRMDRSGAFTLVEGRGLAKTGRLREEVLGKNTEELFRDPEVLAAVKQAFSGRSATAEFRIREVVFEVFLTPTAGSDGKLDGVIGLAVDITERKRAEQRLREEKERLKVTLQSIGDGVIATDGAGRVTLMNAVAEQLTGWTSRNAVGRAFTDVFDIHNEHTGEKCESPVERVLATGRIVGLANHTALRSTDGTVRAIADSAAPILDGARNVHGVILVFRDVTESKKKENEIAYLSYHDRLTGLYNRSFLDEECKRLDTSRQLPISVIMGDVNGLKLTNDVFGHAEGDVLLSRIAGIVRECCRNEDIVARVGGDEFCILLPKTGYATASDVCKRIYARCESSGAGLPSGGARLSISLGHATKSGAGEPIQDVIKSAEDMMYRRKLLESRSQHSSLISSIRMTLFEKSHETEQHAQRLISRSRAIAQALNLPDDQVNDIELFALLHDIGKIAVDDHILTKAGELDEAELAEMHRHPEIGFRIAQASPDLAHIAEFILCHHEWWDGAGYPQGLKGTAIPLLARILLVVDAYDAMTQDRIYRKAMTSEEACAELLLNAGTQFDPNIVWVFLELMEHEVTLPDTY